LYFATDAKEYIKSFLGEMKVKIINKSQHKLPEYSTLFSAGMDLYASLDEPITLKPLERVLIGTGLFIELPVGYEAQIRPRSGLAIKKGITVLNSPGTIDADYRGEIQVILVNLSSEPFVVGNGERICQMIVAKHERVEWETTKELNSSIRGSGGFGHTGV
jgi:dUTP pyrophosphatase